MATASHFGAGAYLVRKHHPRQDMPRTFMLRLRDGSNPCATLITWTPVLGLFHGDILAERCGTSLASPQKCLPCSALHLHLRLSYCFLAPSTLSQRVPITGSTTGKSKRHSICILAPNMLRPLP